MINSTPKTHNQRTTIQHWQLRDLVSCSAPDSVVFVNSNQVCLLNTSTGSSSPVLNDLSFSPTSIALGQGFLAAGGQRSQLMVRQLDSNWSAQTNVGGSINNGLFY